VNINNIYTSYINIIEMIIDHYAKSSNAPTVTRILPSRLGSSYGRVRAVAAAPPALEATNPEGQKKKGGDVREFIRID
jgi:hypothetical protein